MKKIFLLVMILLLSNGAYAKSYKITAENTDKQGIESIEKQEKTIKIKVNGGYSNNRGYARIKVNNAHSIRISTPKLSNNAVLKLVNVAF